MVLISEISEDAPQIEEEEPKEDQSEPEGKQEEETKEDQAELEGKQEEGPKEDGAEPAGKETDDEEDEEEGRPRGIMENDVKVEETSTKTSAPEIDNSIPESSSAAAGQTLYNEYALRVAYIMRSYLYMKQAAGVAASWENPPPSAADSGEERCKAMMEVVRKEHGKWTVSKLVTDHNHSLLPPQDGNGAAAGWSALPLSMGMEFESVEAAKAFYYAYGDTTGFKARMGSNRRSAGSGALIMQRFLCWKGNYLLYKKKSDVDTRKRKRGPYRKIAPKSARKDGDVVEVIQVESSTEKGGVVGEDGGGEVQSGHTVKEAAAVEKEVGTASVDGKGAPVANNPQSRLLRELGIKVSRYTNEERRDIVLKYMMKRNNRQGVERPIKVKSLTSLLCIGEENTGFECLAFRKVNLL